MIGELSVLKSTLEVLKAGKPVGTISTHADGTKWQKQPSGEWTKLKQKKSKKEPEKGPTKEPKKSLEDTIEQAAKETTTVAQAKIADWIMETEDPVNEDALLKLVSEAVANMEGVEESEVFDNITHLDLGEIALVGMKLGFLDENEIKAAAKQEKGGKTPEHVETNDVLKLIYNTPMDYDEKKSWNEFVQDHSPDDIIDVTVRGLINSGVSAAGAEKIGKELGIDDMGPLWKQWGLDLEDHDELGAFSGDKPGKLTFPEKPAEEDAPEEEEPAADEPAEDVPSLPRLISGKEARRNLTLRRSVSEITNSNHLGGSTGADLVEWTDDTGKQNVSVMKKGASVEHVIEETLADQIYLLAGIEAPLSYLATDPNGRQIKMAEFVEGKPFGELTGDDKELALEKLRDGFVVDALLGNWDVTGADGDNILWDAQQQKLFRVDNGGSLRYRAQGKKKEGWAGIVEELDTMRDPKTLGGKVFSEITDDEVRAQIKQLLTHRADILETAEQVDDDIRQILEERMDYLEKWKPGEKAPKGEWRPTAWKNTAYGRLPIPGKSQKEAIKNYRGSGHQNMNSALRKYGGSMDAITKQNIEQIDAYFKHVPEREVDESEPLYRGVGPKFVERLFKGLGFPEFKIENMAGLQKKAPDGTTWEEYLRERLTGVKVNDQGYMSTSASEKRAKDFTASYELTHESAAMLIRITGGKAKAFYMEDAVGYHDEYSDEVEWLFDRGRMLKITDVEFEPFYKSGNDRILMVLNAEVK